MMDASPDPLSAAKTEEQILHEQNEALLAIRDFLKSKTSYDVLPVSFKLVMLDTTMTLKGALLTLLQNGIVSAPIWNSNMSRFAGLLTAADFMNVLKYSLDGDIDSINSFGTKTLDEVRQVETEMGPQHVVENVSLHPMTGLWDACTAIVDSRAHRMPLVDADPSTKREIIVSVLTQYRILRFVALNCKETQNLGLQIGDLPLLTTTENLAVATMDTTLRDIVYTFSERSVSAVPIVDADGKLMNMFETFDILTLVKGQGYAEMATLTVGEALMRRPQDFEGVLTCRKTDRLADVFETIRRSRLLRLFVVDDDGKLTGIMSLCDILTYICCGGEP